MFIFHGESVAAILFRALDFNPAATVRATFRTFAILVRTELASALRASERQYRPLLGFWLLSRLGNLNHGFPH